MSYVTNFNGTFRPNFLESEIGLVLKTHQIPASMGEDDGYGRKIVRAGTAFETTGIVFEDVDVTSGDKAGSVMVAGRALADRLGSNVSTTLKNSEIVFVDAPEVIREENPNTDEGEMMRTLAGIKEE